MTTALVTGAAGFIGRRVSAALDAAGFEVRKLDRSLGHELIDPEVVRRSVDGVRVVLHHAARVGMGVDAGDTVQFVSDNDLGTATLLEGLWRTGFDGRFVLASSMVVYGEGSYRCATPACAHLGGAARPRPRLSADLNAGQFEPQCEGCGQPLTWELVDESAALDPRSTYAATKVAQEHLAAAWARQTGVSVVALRYHNVYGPGLPRGTPYAGVAALFASALAEGRAPCVFEDGGQVRDFVHVDDVAAANLAAVTTDAVSPGCLEAFNVCSGRPVTIIEVAEAMAAAAGGPTPVVTGEYRLGDVRHIVASGAKAAARLGFTAEVPFEVGVKQLVA